MNSYASTIIERVVQNIKNETVLSIIDTNYEMIYNLIKKVVELKQMSVYFKKFYNHMKL